MDLVDDDGLYHEDGMWNTYFHLARERPLRDLMIFLIYVLWSDSDSFAKYGIFSHLFGAMYPISLGYKLIFDSPQSDWLPILWIYSNSPSSLSPSSIFAQQFYQLFSFKTFAPSSQSCSSLERAPLLQRSRTKLSWFTSCECTLAPVRLYSAGLPSAGPKNRFPGRRDSLFWSRVLKCGLRSEARGVTVRNSLGPVCLDISGEHDTVSCVV